jgi:hypothetical protein
MARRQEGKKARRQEGKKARRQEGAMNRALLPSPKNMNHTWIASSVRVNSKS